MLNAQDKEVVTAARGGRIPTTMPIPSSCSGGATATAGAASGAGASSFCIGGGATSSEDDDDDDDHEKMRGLVRESVPMKQLRSMAHCSKCKRDPNGSTSTSLK